MCTWGMCSNVCVHWFEYAWARHLIAHALHDTNAGPDTIHIYTYIYIYTIH